MALARERCNAQLANSVRDALCQLTAYRPLASSETQAIGRGFVRSNFARSPGKLDVDSQREPVERTVTA
jgi:hypothetical protein